MKATAMMKCLTRRVIINIQRLASQKVLTDIYLEQEKVISKLREQDAKSNEKLKVSKEWWINGEWSDAFLLYI